MCSTSYFHNPFYMNIQSWKILMVVNCLHLLFCSYIVILIHFCEFQLQYLYVIMHIITMMQICKYYLLCFVFFMLEFVKVLLICSSLVLRWLTQWIKHFKLVFVLPYDSFWQKKCLSGKFRNFKSLSWFNFRSNAEDRVITLWAEKKVGICKI